MRHGSAYAPTPPTPQRPGTNACGPRLPLRRVCLPELDGFPGPTPGLPLRQGCVPASSQRRMRHFGGAGAICARLRRHLLRCVVRRPVLGPQAVVLLTGSRDVGRQQERGDTV
jgi:hypothetical protein